MHEVIELASQIGDCLGDLTFTLRNSVNIDDTAVLMHIGNSVAVFASLQEQMQRFQLQVNVTNKINVPKSSGIAPGHLSTCKDTIDSAMESMKQFVGLSKYQCHKYGDA